VTEAELCAQDAFVAGPGEFTISPLCTTRVAATTPVVLCTTSRLRGVDEQNAVHRQVDTAARVLLSPRRHFYSPRRAGRTGVTDFS
jgi:hypothetical protein